MALSWKYFCYLRLFCKLSYRHVFGLLHTWGTCLAHCSRGARVWLIAHVEHVFGLLLTWSTCLAHCSRGWLIANVGHVFGLLLTWGTCLAHCSRGARVWLIAHVFLPSGWKAELVNWKSDLPTISENLPTVFEKLPTVSENLPTVFENLPLVSENLPTHVWQAATYATRPTRACFLRQTSYFCNAFWRSNSRILLPTILSWGQLLVFD